MPIQHLRYRALRYPIIESKVLTALYAMAKGGPPNAQDRKAGRRYHQTYFLKQIQLSLERYQAQKDASCRVRLSDSPQSEPQISYAHVQSGLIHTHGMIPQIPGGQRGVG